MTAGVVVVLGEVGRNFAAGMTGGVAFVFDECGEFQKRCNLELVELARLADPESQQVRALILTHYEMTNSPRARSLLSNWESARDLFWHVITQAETASRMKAELPHINIAAAIGPPTTGIALMKSDAMPETSNLFD